MCARVYLAGRSGFVYQHPGGAAADTGGGAGAGADVSGSDPDAPGLLDNLVYTVYSMPKSLQEFVFDFGALGPSTESQYVKAMVQARCV